VPPAPRWGYFLVTLIKYRLKPVLLVPRVSRTASQTGCSGHGCLAGPLAAKAEGTRVSSCESPGWPIQPPLTQQLPFWGLQPVTPGLRPFSSSSFCVSLQSRNSGQQGDMDGARRLGRMARLLSIVSIILGTIIIVLYISLSVRGNISFSFPQPS